ncbi:MAG: M2 family metallopeptidase, partial [Blastomonas sp.]|nr:M2 family metallopeptidase [Blastomonas sp.]
MILRTSLAALAFALAVPTAALAEEAAPQTSAARATAADAEAFVAAAEKEGYEYSVSAGRVFWINSTYLTDDTNALAAEVGAKGTEMQVRFALEAAKYKDVPGLSEETRRKLDKLRGGIVLPAPTTEGAAAELNTIATELQSIYGKGKGTLDGKPVNGSDIEAAMGEVRDPAKLKEMWVSWHDNVGAPMKDDYARMVDIANQGARELGFKNVGAMWRGQYDMSADEFAALTEKLWQQVKPLYDDLHCYTRTKLNEKYGDAVQPETGPIRADLLGNMWAQEWGNIYDIVAPAGAGDIGYDVTQLLEAKAYDPLKMVKGGEAFFSSLGFAPLPETFWQRSQFVKPQDREVVCHASAWDIDNKDDIRIKMCIKVNADDFTTIHHELGHNYYQRAYNKQDPLHLDGANDGFHEAIGDMIALSITPDYLVEIGLLDKAKVPGADKDLGLLLRQGMDKLAFLPFGLLVDRWRWGVFDGSIKPAGYNDAWTALRLQYQGTCPFYTSDAAD